MSETATELGATGCDDHDDCATLPVIAAATDDENDGHVLCPACESSVEDWPWPCGLLSCDVCGHEWRCDCCLKEVLP